MDFALNDEQQAVRDLFRDFAQSEVKPVAAEIDRAAAFPSELFQKVGALGFFSMRYPEPDGSGAGIQSYLIAVEELARESLALAIACAMQSLMGTTFLHRSLEGETRERILAPALRGELLGTICMTEPDAGSDLFSMTTRAEQRGGVWHLTGQKTWITQAPVADLFTVFARTGEQELSVFLVERGAAGLEVGRNLSKLGVRASVTSEVSFSDTPATCMLGSKGAGMSALREVLADIRLMTAGLALGVGRAAYEDSVAYAKERAQFGRPIAKFQAIQHHIAEMRTSLEAARRLTQWAAWCSEQGMECADESAMAKLFATEAAVSICDRACRIAASYGYSTEYPFERYLRDARFTLIGGGTSEILRVNIARATTR